MRMKNKALYKASLEKVINAVEISGKSFLITGASGLIGSCLIDLLMLACGKGMNNHIYALGRSAKKLEAQFSEYLNSNYFHIVEQDICSPINDNLNFDYIIHAASNADPINYAKYPVETMKTNLLGIINVLEYARSHPSCRVELLSTFEVYGNVGKDEYVESEVGLLDFNALRACYPESKRAAETMARCYNDEYNVDVTISRLSSIYGPTMAENDSKAHAQFLRNALAGKDIALKSKGEQKRTYCYVLDAVTGIFTILFHGKKGEAYNVSNEDSIVTIAKLAQINAEECNRTVVFDIPSELESKGFSKSQNCILDNRKLRNLGWQAKYNIREGIKECLSILSDKCNIIN